MIQDIAKQNINKQFSVQLVSDYSSRYKKGEILTFNIQKIKVSELKQKIYECNDVLDPELMKLKFNYQKMQDDKFVTQYFDIFTQNFGNQNPLRIQQKFKKLSEIQGIKLSNKGDSYGCGDYEVVQMPCGHTIGTQGMKNILQATLIILKKPHIFCSYGSCKQQWDFAFCSKIALLTTPQRQKYELEFSKLHFLQNASECPNCFTRVLKSIQWNRVRCPQCFYGDYCYKCNNLWLTPHTLFCGNSNCQDTKDYIKNAPNKQFECQGRKKIMVPSLRSCPNCKNLIFRQRGCKHMKCNKCKTEFCWICLKDKLNQGWQCGDPYQYCGPIAPSQFE